MPRLEIHTVGVEVVEHHRPQRVEGADHQPHGGAEDHGAGERPDPQQVDGEALADRCRLLGDGRAGDQRNDEQCRAGDDEERRRDAERVDEQRRHRRPGSEAADVGGDEPPEVVPEAFRLGEDDDAADRRNRHPDADAHDEAPGEQRQEAGGERHQHEATDVEHHPAEHELAGVAPVGQRGDDQLRQEAGEEPDPDDRARAPTR